MGRYSTPLAPELADFADIGDEEAVLDVGSGPGALTGELVRRLGTDAVAAVDPSEPFVAAARTRYPGVDVHLASADELPFPDGGFDAALAQLVVHFMPDPVAGLTEMARVTRLDGVVAPCVWDLAGGRAPLSPFWRAARELDPGVERRVRPRRCAGRSPPRAVRRGGHRRRRGGRAVGDGRARELRGVVGAVHARRRPRRELCAVARRARARDAPRAVPALLPEAPFPLPAVAWAARGVVGAR